MKIGEYGKITFSSGREFDDGAGAVGLTPQLEVAGGYDSKEFNLEDHLIHQEWIHGGNSVIDEGDYSIEDMRELAVYMIERWTLFKLKLDASAEQSK